MGRDIIRQRARPAEAGGVFSGDTDAALADMRERLAATLARVQEIERVRVSDVADDIDAETQRLGLDAAKASIERASAAIDLLDAQARTQSKDIRQLRIALNELGWEWAYNADTVELEARGAYEVVGRTSIGMVQVAKITSDNLSPGLIRFGGDMPIAVGGMLQVACPFMVECKALYSGSAPAVGDILRTEAGSFELVAADAYSQTEGFRVTGSITETIGGTSVTRVFVMPSREVSLDHKMVDYDTVDPTVSGPYHTIIYQNQGITVTSPGVTVTS